MVARREPPEKKNLGTAYWDPRAWCDSQMVAHIVPESNPQSISGRKFLLFSSGNACQKPAVTFLLQILRVIHTKVARAG